MLKKVFLVTLFMVIFVIESTVYAQIEKKDEELTQVVLIVTPSFSFQEAEWLWEHGVRRSIWEQAAFGAMNVRPDGPYSYLNNSVSISTGNKASGVQDWNGFEKGESANGVAVEDLMLQLTGNTPKSGLVHPLFYRLQEKNRQSPHRAEIGLLGNSLREAKIERIVIGNSDTQHEKIRYGSLFTIDKSGETAGYLQTAIKENRSAPYGIEMDEEFILKLVQHQPRKDRFLVVEWGDFYRLYEQRVLMEERRFQTERVRQLLRFEEFVHNVIHSVNKNVWLLAPMMHQEAYDAKQQLAPIYYWHEGEGGFLSSATTRQAYLVSNLDFVSSVLHTFQIVPNERIIGHAMNIEQIGVVDKQVGFEKVQEMVDIYATRGSVLSSYITSLVLLLIVAGIGTGFARGQAMWIRVIKIVLIAAWSSPLWFLLLTLLFQNVGVMGFVLLLTGCSLLCGYLFDTYSKDPIVLIGAILFVTITVDLWLGSPLMQRSYLGYDPIIGARYYGIGNEYAGVYIITAFACLVPVFRWKKRSMILAVLCLMMFGQLIILGKNILGTNAGATLSAGFAYLFIILLIFGKKISFKLIILLSIVGGSLSLGFLYLLQLSGSQSHIGLAFERLLNGDFLYIVDTIQRKLAMNLKIFRYSNWTQLFITSYILGAIILWKRRRRVVVYEERVFLQGGVIASFALLFLNDSGVVAAATSMFCVVSAHYYWLLSKYGKKYT